MVDRFNRFFLRTLRQLRDLRRYTPQVTIQNAGQVNVNAAVVLARPQRDDNIGPADEPIWNYEHVRQRLTDVNRFDTLLSVVERERIFSVLRKATTQQLPNAAIT